VVAGHFLLPNCPNSRRDLREVELSLREAKDSKSKEAKVGRLDIFKFTRRGGDNLQPAADDGGRFICLFGNMLASPPAEP